jgi:hypothetical protein
MTTKRNNKNTAARGANAQVAQHTKHTKTQEEEELTTPEIQRIALLRVAAEQGSTRDRVVKRSRLRVVERDVRAWTPEAKHELEEETNLIRESHVSLL